MHVYTSFDRDDLDLTPDSCKHASWIGSDTVRVCPLVLCTMALAALLAGGVGVTIGFLVNRLPWGLGACALVIAACYVLSFVTLIMYMVSYGDGLARGRMPGWLERLGYACNMRANILCRFYMTCCFNGRFHLFGMIMDGEAANTLRRLRGSHDGRGPPAGGVCWLGDSEFTAWHHLSTDMAPFHTHNFNAGFGGARACDVRVHLDRLCLTWRPALVIVHVSGNDYDTEPWLTPVAMAERLLSLFEAVIDGPRHESLRSVQSQHSVQKLGYLLSSRRPAYSDRKWEWMLDVGRRTLEGLEAKPSLAERVFVLDLRRMEHPLEDFVAVDRVHLNRQGHRRKAEALLPLLEQERAALALRRDGFDTV